MADIFDMADTWNAGATTFTAIKMNVTDTASAAASLLMDLQVGGTSRFQVGKGAGAYFQSNIAEIRNSTTAQSLRVYNTFTDASNYERAIIQYSSNVLEIGHQVAGTGTAGRQIVFVAGGNTLSSSWHWRESAAGAATFTRMTLTNETAPKLKLRQSGIFGWTSSTSSADGALATGVVATTAGVVRFCATSETVGSAAEFIEQTAPTAPATNGVRIYAEDNGAGKTRLMALFATGAAQQIAIEP
jgi:hypothetical protein